MFGDLIFGVELFADAQRNVGPKYLFVKAKFHDIYPFTGLLTQQVRSTLNATRTYNITLNTARAYQVTENL